MEQGFQIENLLGNLMANPELLSGVLSMAGKLAGSFTSAPKEEESAPPTVEAFLPAPTSAPKSKRHEMGKHKRLVEALMLYVSEEKRPKLEMVLKILEIVELAEDLRG